MVKQAQQFIEKADKRLTPTAQRKLLREVAERVAKKDKAEKEARARRKLKSVKVKGKKGKTTTKLISMGEYRN